MDRKTGIEIGLLVGAVLLGLCAWMLLFYLAMMVANGVIVLRPEPGTNVLNQDAVMKYLDDKYGEPIEIVQKDIVSVDKVVYTCYAPENDMSFETQSYRNGIGSEIPYDDNPATIRDDYDTKLFLKQIRAFLDEHRYAYEYDESSSIFSIAFDDSTAEALPTDLAYFCQSVQTAFDWEKPSYHLPELRLVYHDENHAAYKSSLFLNGDYVFSREIAGDRKSDLPYGMTLAEMLLEAVLSRDFSELARMQNAKVVRMRFDGSEDFLQFVVAELQAEAKNIDDKRMSE